MIVAKDKIDKVTEYCEWEKLNAKWWGIIAKQKALLEYD